MVELREARKIASSSGLGLQYVLKEARVFDIWGRLSPLIMSGKIRSKAIIVSKGGTALNKIYLSGVQRFSEDLDFDAFFKGSPRRGRKIEFLQSELREYLATTFIFITISATIHIKYHTSWFESRFRKREID